MIYQPKGGMCQTCTRANHDCSGLPFSTMPVISRWNGVAIVRCTHQIKSLEMPQQQPERVALSSDALADLCEAWLQAGGASNIVDAFEAGFRSCEARASARAAAEIGKTK